MNEFAYNKEEIKKVLPHRDPFLFADSVQSVSDKSIITVYTITDESFWVEGHFPGMPIMPGVLLIEMMAQASGILSCINNKDFQDGRLVVLESARFRRNVLPGDELLVHSEIVEENGKVVKYECYIECKGTTVADASIVLAFNS